MGEAKERERERREREPPPLDSSGKQGEVEGSLHRMKQKKVVHMVAVATEQTKQTRRPVKQLKKKKEKNKTPKKIITNFISFGCHLTFV